MCNIRIAFFAGTSTCHDKDRLSSTIILILRVVLLQGQYLPTTHTLLCFHPCQSFSIKLSWWVTQLLDILTGTLYCAHLHCISKLSFYHFSHFNMLCFPQDTGPTPSFRSRSCFYPCRLITIWHGVWWASWQEWLLGDPLLSSMRWVKWLQCQQQNVCTTEWTETMSFIMLTPLIALPRMSTKLPSIRKFWHGLSIFTAKTINAMFKRDIRRNFQNKGASSVIMFDSRNSTTLPIMLKPTIDQIPWKGDARQTLKLVLISMGWIKGRDN